MASAAVLPRQQLIWRSSPVWPFAWRGLGPLLMLALATLLAVGPFARSSIQATVERELRQQLDAAGFHWVGLSVSGQEAKLTGTEPSGGEGARALQLARTASCPTWLGHYTCATAVTANFLAPVEALPLPPPAAALSPHPAEVATAPLTRQACESSLASILGTEQIEFASGSAKIDAKSAALLDQLAREVKACPGKIRIEGYTDTVGRGHVNQRLSAERAAAVRSALITRGIPASRLSAKGFGARRAIADNSTAEGRARNRRIEFHTVTK